MASCPRMLPHSYKQVTPLRPGPDAETGDPDLDRNLLYLVQESKETKTGS